MFFSNERPYFQRYLIEQKSHQELYTIRKLSRRVLHMAMTRRVMAIASSSSVGRETVRPATYLDKIK